MRATDDKTQTQTNAIELNRARDFEAKKKPPAAIDIRELRISDISHLKLQSATRRPQTCCIA
jgi:hypothetical protein